MFGLRAGLNIIKDFVDERVAEVEFAQLTMIRKVFRLEIELMQLEGHSFFF